jgi:hypothetical protein
MRHANVARLLVMQAPRVASRLRTRAPGTAAAAAKPPGSGQPGRPAHRPQTPPAAGIVVRPLQRLLRAVAACVCLSMRDRWTHALTLSLTVRLCPAAARLVPRRGALQR